MFSLRCRYTGLNAAFILGVCLFETTAAWASDCNTNGLADRYEIHGRQPYNVMTPVSLGEWPALIRLGDLDNDGVLDLVAHRHGWDGITLLFLRGLGNGEFGTPHVLSEGLELRTLLVLDVDRDGDLDIVAGPTGGGAAWFENRGSAAFSSSRVIVDGPALLLGAGDFDVDGADDLLFHRAANGLRLHLNLGNAKFSTPVHSPAPVALSKAVFADFNGDGHLDVAANEQHVARTRGSSRILFGQAGGRFTEGPIFVAGVTPKGIEAADLDGDGAVDLIVTFSDSDRGGLLSIFWNDGGGTRFVERTHFPSAIGTHSIVARDLDSDGRLDLVVANTGESRSVGSVSVYRGTSRRHFEPRRDYPTSWTTIDLEVGDLDGDGHGDVVTRNARELSVLFGLPRAKLLAPIFLEQENSVSGLEVVDTNDDGVEDLLTVTLSREEATLLIREGFGDGSFRPPWWIPLGVSCEGSADCITYPAEVTARDFNRDGETDIAVTLAKAQRVQILRRIEGRWMTVASIDLPAVPRSVSFPDLDGDGLDDLLVLQHGTVQHGTDTEDGAVLVRRSLGDGTFAAAEAFEGPSFVRAVVPLDMDGDGDRDLVVGGVRAIWLFEHVGPGHFTFVKTLLEGPTPQGKILAVDIDDDGALEVFVPYLTGGAHILVQKGPFEFESSRLDVESALLESEFVDVDVDGDLDLVGTTPANELQVLENRQGRFEVADSVSIPEGVETLRRADVDRDGRDDLVLLIPGYHRSLPFGGRLFFDRGATVVLRNQSLEPAGTDIDGDGRLDACRSVRFVRGDVDANQSEDLGDVLVLLNFLFTEGFEPDCLEAADVDDSSAVNVTDAVSLLNYLFLSGMPPKPPHGDCGVDPDEDTARLGCGRFGACDA